MSFDLAVFRPRKALDAAAAGAIYAALTSEGASAPAGLVRAKELVAFYEALTARYPEIDDEPDESPFAVAIERRPDAVVINLSFSRVDEVAHAIEQLAKAHGLDVYDPQERRLICATDPDAVRRPAPAQKKLSPKEGLARFVAGVGPGLEALGFAPVPRAKHTWRRRSAEGVLHRIGLNLATREVRTDVAVGHERVLPWLAAATGAREPLPAMSLGYLHLRGWIPGEPWRDDAVELEYAIDHAGRVEKSAERFVRDVERFAAPFFDALGTTAAIADFFTRTKTFAKPRANWGLERETVAGPSERFWREDRALLLEIAMRALADPSSLDACVAEAQRRGAVWTKKDIYGGSPQLAGFITALARTIRDEIAPTKASTKTAITAKTKTKAAAKPKNKSGAAKRRG